MRTVSLHKMERWRPVPGYEGHYEVSDHGRVRSLERQTLTKAGWYRRVPPKELKQSTRDDGYLVVTLCLGPARKQRTVGVHILVLQAFVGPRPVGQQLTRHLDDDPTNNHLSNLRWGTHSENRRDSVQNGGHFQSSKTHCPAKHEYAVHARIYNGRRYCKECDRLRPRNRRKKGSEQ